ncbi:hypothetical protein LC653_38115 [Nostoc sp. CHAB 5784]|uniref:methyltransferase family protein n=1 Tax=Nostoc mirabile TaxID=2907820 RepID=UPI001E46DF2F|nr:methyltransferase dimerization domain-containing protein [Nostoc mirabile]MCC5669492.1 hypothetical protein [Nostoc mirabile CHAB5784]
MTSLISKSEALKRIFGENKDSLAISDLSLLLFGHAAFQYLYAGAELGLFEILSKKTHLSKAEISEYLQLETYPVKCLLLGLTALKLVIKKGNSFDLQSVNQPTSSLVNHFFCEYFTNCSPRS